MQLGIIIQSRNGSTRLPNKATLPFWKDKNILEIIIGKLKSIFPNDSIIVATTNNNEDDAICGIAEKEKVRCFRGDELNVLKRFVDTAEYFKINQIIRICGDNPFISAGSIADLFAKGNKNYDYCCYSLHDNIPSITSHIGIYPELVQLDTLKKVQLLTTDKKSLEHVTYFIYNNPKIFKCLFLPADQFLRSRDDIRLTVDTAGDFCLMQEIFAKIGRIDGDEKILQIVEFIDQNPQFLEIMKNNISENAK